MSEIETLIEGDLQAAGGSAAQVQALRQQLVGNQAASRLQALDQQRQSWKQRLQRFQQEKSAIDTHPGLSPAQGGDPTVPDS